MCQLLALSANTPVAVNFSFTGLSARGGLTGDHADGYGLAFHDDGVCRHFIDDGRASDSALADFLRRHPFRARTVLAHIRKATQGAVRLANCHPFVREWQGRHWSFCHNGDLKGFHPRLAGIYQPVGDTDSEKAFCWLLQALRRRFRVRGRLGWQAIAPVLAELVDQLATRGTFNVVLSDGETLYVHASTKPFWVQRAHPFAVAHLVDHDIALDLGAFNGSDDRMVVVATEPLTRDERWTAFETGEMRVFERGELVWRRQGRASDEPLDDRSETAERYAQSFV